MKTLLLTQADVRALVTMENAVAAVERAFGAHGRGETVMPPKVYLPLHRHDGDFRAMPAYLDGSAGVKWVNAHPKNPERHGLPSVMALYVLSDPETAAPLAIMDATLLTAMRTGAAAGVAARYLAAGAPRTVGFIGSGVQARFILEALRAVLGGGFEVLAADLAPAAAARFAAEAGGRAVGIDDAAGADLVNTATPSRTPIVRRASIRPGAHLNAMGADAPGKQELESTILRDARIFIDDREQAVESGEVNVPLHDGTIQGGDIAGTLGEVIAGRIPGRTAADQITVFDSTGLAIQDLALARVVYDAARVKGAGVEVELVPS